MDIKTISKNIKNVINNASTLAALPIPLMTLLCAGARKPGLSLYRSLGFLLSKLSKKGIPTDGENCNHMNIVMAEIIKEVMRALREDANIQIAIEPMSIQFGGAFSPNENPIRAYGSFL